jgi:adenosylmethionine-8-amino-7-oxononanoate aminotransferase
MITFAKAVTSGYVPLSGVIVGPAVMAGLETNEGFVLRTGYTYSGHPVACAAALKCIEIQEDEGLLARATAIGERLSAGLRELQDEGLLINVRGEGAVWGISVPADVDIVATRDALLGEGVIIRPIPPNHFSMCPPFVISDEQIDKIVSSLRKILVGSLGSTRATEV